MKRRITALIAAAVLAFSSAAAVPAEETETPTTTEVWETETQAFEEETPETETENETDTEVSDTENSAPQTEEIPAEAETEDCLFRTPPEDAETERKEIEASEPATEAEAEEIVIETKASAIETEEISIETENPDESETEEEIPIEAEEIETSAELKKAEATILLTASPSISASNASPLEGGKVTHTIKIRFSGGGADSWTCFAATPKNGMILESVSVESGSYYSGKRLNVIRSGGEESVPMNGTVNLTGKGEVGKIEIHMTGEGTGPKSGTVATVVLTGRAGKAGTDAGCMVGVSTWRTGLVDVRTANCENSCPVRASGFAAVGPNASAKGLRISNGKLTYQGEETGMVGINFYDPIEYSASKGVYQKEAVRKVFDAMKKNGMSYCRVSFSPYWPSDYAAYAADEEKWFGYLDAFIRQAEDAGIGVIPTLFWNGIGTSDWLGENFSAWGDGSSRTRKFMAEYVRKVATRYADSPAVWGWEFSNEMNLWCDLPNAAEAMRGTVHPEKGTPSSRTAKDYLTTAALNSAYSAFRTEIRKYDPYRIVLSGNSAPRERAYGMYESGGKSWGDLDSEEELKKIMNLQNPGDAVTVHLYGDSKRASAEASNEETFVGVLKRCADALGKILVIEEFGGTAAEFGSATVNSEISRIMNAVLKNGIKLSSVWAAFANEGRESKPDALRNAETPSIGKIAAYGEDLAAKRGGTTWKNSEEGRKPLPKPSAVGTQVVAKGTAARPRISVPGLAEGRDFSTTYYNETKAGTATAIVVGKGSYGGTARIDYQVRYQLPAANAVSAQTYSGKALTPAVSISGLAQGRDYSVSYSNNVSAGTATATLTGRGDYAGTRTASFRINPKKLPQLSGDSSEKIYSGKEIRPSAWISGLRQGTDYVLSYSNNVKSGTATVRATGKGNYSGTSSFFFRIKENKTFSVKLKTALFVYTGKAVKPKAAVSKDGKTVPSNYLTFSYSGNKNAGIGTVKVSGKGKYAGCSGKATFEIKPPKATLKSFSAGKKKGTGTVSWKKNPQASGWQIQYSIKKNFAGAKTVEASGGKTSVQMKGLASKKTVFVRARMYKKSGGRTLYGAWSGTKSAKIR